MTHKVIRGIHDKNITELINYLLEEKDYVMLEAKVEYPRFSDVIGEIDLLGLRKSGLDFFEVKSNYSHKSFDKAQKQLQRARNYFNIQGNDYFYSNGKLLRIR